MKFIDFILKQKERDDMYGDLARDVEYHLAHLDHNFIGWNKIIHYLNENYDKSVVCPERRFKEIKSDTLYGMHSAIPWEAQFQPYILESLIGIWKAWLGHKKIGLKYKKNVDRGFVYFFWNKENNIYKIGKTAKLPDRRKFMVEISEKLDLMIYNWLYIDNYSIIEDELKKAFNKGNILREWFKFEFSGIRKDGTPSCLEIDQAMQLYLHTDIGCQVMDDKDETLIYSFDEQEILQMSDKVLTNDEIDALYGVENRYRNRL